MLVSGVILVVATSLLVAQTPSKRIVEAEEFILRGPQGQELAKLDGMGTGAALWLYDNQHRARVALTTADGFDHKGVAVFRSTGQVAATFGVDDGDDPRIDLDDKTGRSIAFLGLTNGDPTLVFTDKEARPRAMLYVRDVGPSISLLDEQAKPKADLEVTDQGPKMRMWDSNSIMRVAMGVTRDGVSGVTITSGVDPKKGSVFIGADTKGGDVFITGPDGQPRNVFGR
jgi:hypothetical protein